MTQGVECYLLVESCGFDRSTAGVLQCSRGDWATRVVAGKQPFAQPLSPPIGGQDAEELLRQHDVSVLAALAIADVDHHPLAGRSYEADLASDDEAREHTLMLLNEETIYPYAEVWDRARLVCTVRKGE
jgi:hypothetical protein